MKKKDTTKKDIIEIDGIPCIVVSDEVFPPKRNFVFVEIQLEKELNFIEDVIKELEKLFDDASKKDKGN